MPKQIVIKKPQPNFPFDEPLALIEAKNIERTFSLHYERCDSPDAAEYLANVFSTLGKRFERKKVALEAKVG
jgi:hypothetical protein